MTLVVDSLTKRFEGAADQLLSGVSFVVPNGSLTCLRGPSGAGKTTVLHLIAGLLAADSGTVAVDGESLDNVPTHRRPLTLLMQQPHLFAHLDVIDNVAFGLRVRNVARRERRRRATEMLAMVGIAELADRSVARLSGGEQQRVALARALVIEPAVLLADEPFASVDAPTRHDLQTLLRRLQGELGTTILLVTHDNREADRIADRQLELAGGRIVPVARVDNHTLISVNCEFTKH
ncbi:MAG: ABC transporter ATP-binding protein [Acidimicrobiia bacterium]